MKGLTKRQGVKINAALSMIYGQGYDAQAVVTWAREFQRQGYPVAKSYERALNEFIGGQPEMQAQLVRVNRLLEASDDASIGKYEAAINQYIETGDGSAIDALAPMMARDSVELARRNGELRDGAITPENVETALGFSLPGEFVQAATQEAGPVSQQGATQPFAFRTQEQPAQRDGPDYNNGAQSGEQPYCGRQANMNAAFNMGSLGPSRTILEGRVVNPVNDGVVGEPPSI